MDFWVIQKSENGNWKKWGQLKTSEGIILKSSIQTCKKFNKTKKFSYKKSFDLILTKIDRFFNKENLNPTVS